MVSRSLAISRKFKQLMQKTNLPSNLLNYLFRINQHRLAFLIQIMKAWRQSFKLKHWKSLWSVFVLFVNRAFDEKDSSSRASRQKKWIVDVASSTNRFYTSQLFLTLRLQLCLYSYENCFMRDKEWNEQRRELNLVLKCNKTSELRLEIY